MNSKSTMVNVCGEEEHNYENKLRYCPKSYSSLSMDDCYSINFSDELYSAPLDRMVSKSILGYCTIKRPKQYFGEWRESDTNTNCVFSSLSENPLIHSKRRMSRVVSDDLMVPTKFKNRLPRHRTSFSDGKHFMIKNKFEKRSLDIDGCLLSENTISQNEDAFDALRELDAVLDIHDASLTNSVSANQTESEHEHTNIEDYLLDLDDYLELMDQSTASDYNRKMEKDNINIMEDKTEFPRGSNLRRTVGCTTEIKASDCVLKNQKKSKGTPCATMRHSCTRSYSNALVGQKKLKTKTIGLLSDGNCDGVKDDMRSSNESAVDQQSSICNDWPSILQNEYSDRNSLDATQLLTEDQIFQNIIEQNENQRSDNELRPRQYGRRAERNSRISTNQNFTAMNSHNLSPISALELTSSPILQTEQFPHNSAIYVGSDGSTARSSRSASPVTILSSSDSSEFTSSNNVIESDLVNRENEQENVNTLIDHDNSGELTHKMGFNMYWPHSYSRTLALLSCTLGLFNICRFAVLTINYGPNFLIQFFLLSIIFGIPFFWLQMCLGAKIKAGPVSMWKISPICSGIGISLVVVQYFITIYSSVVVVYLLVYMSDTFRYQSSYPWSEASHFLSRNSTHSYYNITESIADYFNVIVLQRQLIQKVSENNGIRMHISDRLTFYLVILWTTVFLILCKGLKSFGKILIVIGVLPLIALAVVTGKLLCIVDLMKLQNVFSSSEFDDFLINSKTWTSAAQETFLTWGLLGTSIIAISSRGHKNRSKMTLRRDAILVVLITLGGLCLSAVMGLCCTEILSQSGYVYVPGSYEKPESYSSIYSLKSSTSINVIFYPAKLVPHYSGVIGEVYRRQKDVKSISGYQVLRFVSELFPAMLVIAGNSFSWIWATVVFAMLLVFGIAQLCVMWKPISSALGNSTSAVLLSCVTGLILSIPFATEVGITLLHYMDSLIGGSWFIPVLWAAEILGVFLIRGRPYNGDDLVNDLKMSTSMSAFLALSWNVMLPISLITLAVIEYKISGSSQLYYWRGKSYYTYWARKVGALVQIGILLLVPITCIVQICRYLTTGPPDILDRIQMLYRPLEGVVNAQALNRNPRDDMDFRSRTVSNVQEDVPPKYTPPPSYTTATGARLAKMLRQSIRRSVRRILGGSGRSRPILSIQMEQSYEHQSSPPDYSSVLTNPCEISQQVAPTISESIEVSNSPTAGSIFGRSLSLGRKNVLRKNYDKKMYQHHSTLSGHTRQRRSSATTRPYTAEDVITILRPSTDGNGTSQAMLPQIAFRSIENLVLNAEPPGISSSIVAEHLNENDHINTSVI